jgi:aspartyl-tRNA(Asn)/glutamyl-tRNA(Gln) amidotransferase subunit B
MYATGKDAAAIIEEKGLVQVSDTSEILSLIQKVLDDNAGELEKFFSGKTKIRGFFVGQVMKMSKGKANPALLNQILDEELDRRQMSKS